MGILLPAFFDENGVATPLLTVDLSAAITIDKRANFALYTKEDATEMLLSRLDENVMAALEKQKNELVESLLSQFEFNEEDA